MKHIIGVDLGGTKIAVALADSKGKILKEITAPTEAKKGPKFVIDKIINIIHSLDTCPERNRGIRHLALGIGLGVPGPIIYEKGTVLNPPNLPGWEKIPLKKILEKKLKTKVYIENDANCAALAELKFGAGRGHKNFIYVTLSTGIGGGIIIDGKLYRGATGTAGEVGHIPIDRNGPKCGCGLNGDLESMASGRAFKPDAITVEKAARNGEKWALTEIEKVAEILGIGFAGVVNLLNPELIIIGGGLSNMGELLLKPVRKYVKQHALSLPVSSVKIVRAKLGARAGVMGAVALCI